MSKGDERQIQLTDGKQHLGNEDTTNWVEVSQHAFGFSKSRCDLMERSPFQSKVGFHSKGRN